MGEIDVAGLALGKEDVAPVIADARAQGARAKELSIDTVDWRAFMDYIRK
jgi:hypothetical protein